MSLFRFAALSLVLGPGLLVAGLFDKAGPEGKSRPKPAEVPETQEAAESGSKSRGFPPIYLEKVRATPSFYQCDPRAEFPNGGSQYCCPTAVSNSLICLSKLGCKGLAETKHGNALENQIELINTLASEEYCGTDAEEGTPPSGLLQGVRRYVEEKGYECERLEYKGWRPLAAGQKSTIKGLKPDLGWLKSGISNPKGAVWLNVGWYVGTETSGVWKRTGGHWLTLAGYGSADGETLEPNLLVIRNPFRRTSHSDPDDVIHLTLLNQGEATSSNGNRRSLSGSYRVTGLPIKNGTWAILDTAVVLVVGDQ